jgi:hypothetical protein
VRFWARVLLAGVGGGEGLFFGGGSKADIDGEGVGIDQAVDDAGDVFGIAGAGELCAIGCGGDEAEDIGFFAFFGDFEATVQVAEFERDGVFFDSDEGDLDECGFAIAADLVEGAEHVIAAGKGPVFLVDGFVGVDTDPTSGHEGEGFESGIGLGTGWEFQRCGGGGWRRFGSGGAGDQRESGDRERGEGEEDWQGARLRHGETPVKPRCESERMTETQDGGMPAA